MTNPMMWIVPLLNPPPPPWASDQSLLLCTRLIVNDLRFLHAGSEDSKLSVQSDLSVILVYTGS